MLIIRQIATNHCIAFCACIALCRCPTQKVLEIPDNSGSFFYFQAYPPVQNESDASDNISHVPPHLFSYGSWWRHQMETFSAWLALCVENSPVTGEFPTQRLVTRSFDVFFALRLKKTLSKQWWGWWFETLSRPLWRPRNVGTMSSLTPHGLLTQTIHYSLDFVSSTIIWQKYPNSNVDAELWGRDNTLLISPFISINVPYKKTPQLKKDLFGYFLIPILLKHLIWYNKWWSIIFVCCLLWVHRTFQFLLQLLDPKSNQQVLLNICSWRGVYLT